MGAWLDLLIAGLLGVQWSVCLKYSHGFTVLPYTEAAVAGMLASFFFLAQAAKALPIGTAYVVWTGIGAAGAFLAGVVLFREPVTPARCFFAALLLTGIVGLKLTSGE